ncbi:hypothetical protein BGZ96_008683 [Linnemannia gamsii]|uniref:Uncharacterized protein n=1 Tax=Linnemannia gamsii TaxID=64522 RepID=A0ABQ7JYA3_9FUNG|nr:hypothetical protein BGZ96_008683 [Linnemannia gamsii]
MGKRSRKRIELLEETVDTLLEKIQDLDVQNETKDSNTTQELRKKVASLDTLIQEQEEQIQDLRDQLEDNNNNVQEVRVEVANKSVMVAEQIQEIYDEMEDDRIAISVLQEKAESNDGLIHDIQPQIEANNDNIEELLVQMSFINDQLTDLDSKIEDLLLSRVAAQEQAEKREQKQLSQKRGQGNSSDALKAQVGNRHLQNKKKRMD